MDPVKVVQNLILIVGSTDPYFTPRVRVSALHVLLFLCELDTHPEFRYSDERANPYFEVITKNFEEFAMIVKRFSEFYSPANLEKFSSELERQNSSSDGMQVDEESSSGLSVFSSQYFLRAYLSFLFVLV